MCISTFWLSEFALKTFLNTLHRSASKFIIFCIIVSYNIWWGREEQDRFHEENSWIFMLSVNNFTLSDVTLVSFRCVIVWRTEKVQFSITMDGRGQSCSFTHKESSALSRSISASVPLNTRAQGSFIHSLRQTTDSSGSTAQTVHGRQTFGLGEIFKCLKESLLLNESAFIWSKMQ